MREGRSVGRFERAKAGLEFVLWSSRPVEGAEAGDGPSAPPTPQASSSEIRGSIALTAE